MLMSLRKTDLNSLFKEVRVFKGELFCLLAIEAFHLQQESASSNHLDGLQAKKLKGVVRQNVLLRRVLRRLWAKGKGS